jgi:hypothetical protein
MERGASDAGLDIADIGEWQAGVRAMPKAAEY